MSLRILVLYVLGIGLSIYAWRDWFKSLCGLIVLTAAVMYPEFPKTLAGIQGLNLWNLVFANVFLAWLVNRQREGLVWDMPRNISVLLILWLVVVLFGWVWMLADRSRLTWLTPMDMISDDLVNTVKWVIPALLLFDGCRSRRRVEMVLICVLLMFALFIVQIIKAVPPAVALEAGDTEGRMLLDSRVGLSANGAGKMMSGVPWAMLAVLPLLKTRRYRYLMIGLCLGSVYCVALAGSRSGFVACFATLVLLCFVRWRRYLPLLPLAVILAPVAFPGAASRMMSGFGETSVTGDAVTDTHEVTSGRNEIWAMVIPKILESPAWGFGRRAMPRIGLTQNLRNTFGADAGMAVHHPHNAYLEVLLESGLIGFVIIVGLYARLWVYSMRLFATRGDPLCAAVAGVALALLSGHLVAHLGGQSFYPREIDVGVWCALGVMLRAHVERGCLVAQVEGVGYQGASYQEDYSFASIVGRF